ncbi:VOC family protein [Mesorhizobium xinjiangense]|uniref:VOC family protein n=1 Tax=Mesorhizobium xinjiangense TaxID=2678685 RepID=UPI0012EE7D7E|nr:VOC family protein [Mesorhizobium xinjiangense]
MKLEPRISVITLGVDDLDRAAGFYDAMGLERNRKFTEGVAFFQMGGMILALWPRAELAKDAGLADTPPTASGGEAVPGFSGVALAYNTRSEAEVAAILDQAETAGGRILRPAARAFWGGVQGYFTDTEGNLWEVAHNPEFPIDTEGRIALPQ